MGDQGKFGNRIARVVLENGTYAYGVYDEGPYLKKLDYKDLAPALLALAKTHPNHHTHTCKPTNYLGGHLNPAAKPPQLGSNNFVAVGDVGDPLDLCYNTDQSSMRGVLLGECELAVGKGKSKRGSLGTHDSTTTPKGGTKHKAQNSAELGLCWTKIEDMETFWGGCEPPQGGAPEPREPLSEHGELCNCAHLPDTSEEGPTRGRLDKGHITNKTRMSQSIHIVSGR